MDECKPLRLGQCSEAAGLFLGLAVHDTAQVMGRGFHPSTSHLNLSQL